MLAALGASVLGGTDVAYATSHGQSLFELIGGNETIVKTGEYVDPGARCIDFDGQTVPVRDVLINQEDMLAEIPGLYSHVYECTRQGTTISLIRTIIFHDTVPPIITFPKDVVYHDVNDVFAFPPASCIDELEMAEGTFVLFPNPSSLRDILAKTSLGYACVDKSENSAFGSITLVVHDGTPPYIMLDGDNPLVVQNTRFSDPGAECVGTEYPTTRIRLPDAPIAYTITPDISNRAGKYIQTYTCTIEGLQLSTDRIILVNDVVPPKITITGLATVKHPLGLPYEDAGATCNDVIEGPLRVLPPDMIDVNTAATHKVKYVCRDSSGNEVSKSRAVIVSVDTAPPTLIINGSKFVRLEAKMDTYVELGAKCSDTADSFITLNVTGEVDTDKVDVYFVKYTCEDRSKFVDTQFRRVEVVDTFKPVMTLNGTLDPILEAAVDSYEEEGAACKDFVDGKLVPLITGTVDNLVLGKHQVVYECRDLSDNLARLVRNVTVADTVPPVIPADPSHIVIPHDSTYVEEDQHDTPTCTDMADPSPEIDHNGTDVDTSILGDQTILFVCTDDGGNNDTTTRLLTITDQANPIIDLGGAAEVFAAQDTAYVDIPKVTCADAADLDPNFDDNSTEIDTGILGMQTILYVCTDAAGNGARATRSVEVVTGLPRITVSGNNTILERPDNAVPTARCVDDEDGLDIKLAGGNATITPDFDPASTFTPDERTRVHTIKFTCGDHDGNLVVETAIFTHVDAVPIINVPGLERVNFVETDASRLANLRMAGLEYGDEGVWCYHHTFGEVGVSTASDPTALTFTTSITADSDAGEYAATYRCGATSSFHGQVLAEVASRTVTLVERFAPVLANTDATSHIEGTNYEDPVICRGILDGIIPHTSTFTDSDGTISGAIGPGTPAGTYMADYTCEQEYLGMVFTADAASGTVAVKSGLPRITVTGNNTILEQLETDIPAARCVDDEDGTDILLGGSNVTIQPEFDPEHSSTYEEMKLIHTVTFTCGDHDGNIVTEKAIFTQVDVFPIILVPGFVNELGFGESYESRLANLRLVGSEYADAGVMCYHHTFGEVGLSTASDPTQLTFSTSITADSGPGEYSANYVCVLEHHTRGEISAVVFRKVTLVARFVPVLANTDAIPHIVGTNYEDPVICKGILDNIVTHTSNFTDSGGNKIGAIGPGTPAGTYMADYACEQEYFGKTFTADAASGTITVKLGLPRITVSGNNTILERPDNVVPTARCVDDEDGLDIKLAGRNATITPDFDPASTFTPDERTRVHTIEFTCGDHDGNLVVETATFTHVDAVPIINVPGLERVNFVETDASRLANLRMVGSEYADEGVWCYHHTFGEVGVSTASDPTALTFTTSITADSDAGEYAATYRCEATSSFHGQVLAEVASRTVTLVARFAPVLENTAAIPHTGGTDYEDPVICKGILDNVIPHTSNFTDSGGNKIGSIGPDTPAGTYMADYACEQEYLGMTFMAGAASGTITVSDPTIPALDVNNPKNTYLMHISEYTIDATCEDDGMMLDVDDNLDEIPETEGNHTITFGCTDGTNAAERQARFAIVDRTAPVVSPKTINGVIDTIINQDSMYGDPGADCDPGISGIMSQGDNSTRFDPGIVGTHTIQYWCMDNSGNRGTAQRAITVRAISTDMRPPVIRIFGDNPVMHPYKVPYVDDGAVCTDDVDEDRIIRGNTSDVDVARVGSYLVTYECTDMSGKSASDSRRVNVLDSLTLILLGPNPMTIRQYSEYIEPYADCFASSGAEAILNITGDVNTRRLGTYYRDYVCYDGAKLSETDRRSVLVVGSSGNDGDWILNPTSGLAWDTGIRIVSDGFAFDGRAIDITNNFHTEFDADAEIGKMHTMSIKAYTEIALQIMGVYFGVPDLSRATDAESTIYVDVQRNYTLQSGYSVLSIRHEQDEQLVDTGFTTAVMHETPCGASNNFTCQQLDVTFMITAPFSSDILAFSVMDMDRRVTVSYINNGIEFTGEPTLPPATASFQVKRGNQHHPETIHLVQNDRRYNLWEDQHGYAWIQNTYGSWFQVTHATYERLTDQFVSVMTRSHSTFEDLIEYERARAALVFNSSKIESQVGESFAYDVPVRVDKLKDPEILERLRVAELAALEFLRPR